MSFFLNGYVLYKKNHDMVLLRSVDNINAPPMSLNVLSSPWPFSMWGMDVIEPIEPKTSNGHCFILVAIDYFTKWVKAASYANITQNMIVKFIKRELICHYGIPIR